GLLEGLARLDDAAGQGDLTRVPWGIAAHREHDVRVFFAVLRLAPFGASWEDEQQAGRMADARDVDAFWPCAARHRRHSRMPGRPGKLEVQGRREAGDRLCERHGTIDMNAQDACGAG